MGNPRRRWPNIVRGRIGLGAQFSTPIGLDAMRAQSVPRSSVLSYIRQFEALETRIGDSCFAVRRVEF
ncbi:hypothetical protein [Nocardia sp. NPDC019395]|uniref:hypothetical protein n=1 Tax=Nocardia sp. NPDC019395 TaxID=3154686 RepID=UPI0033CAD11A